MYSNIQKQARVLLPFGSAGYEAYLKEEYPEEFIASRTRTPTNCEIRMAIDEAKPRLANCSRVRVLSNYHRAVVVRRDGTTEPPLKCENRGSPSAASQSASSGDGFAGNESSGNGFAFDPADATGRSLIVLPKPNLAASELSPSVLSDNKSAISSAAKSAAPRPSQRFPTSAGAQGLAKITGQQPLVGWDGKMFGIKAPNGQTVFYKSVSNANTVYPPGTKRITLEMQEKERLEARARADAAGWEAMPVHKKVAALVSETFKLRIADHAKISDDKKSAGQRHAKALIEKQRSLATEMREGLSSKAKAKIDDVKMNVQQRAASVQQSAANVSSQLRERAAELAAAVKEQTMSNAKNTFLKVNARATDAGRKFWQNANQFLRRTPSEE